MSAECNVDDILCQMGVLQNLRGLQIGMGNETFLKEFPELQGMDEKLTAKIESSTLAVSEALAKCGKATPGETIEEVVVVKPLSIVSIEEVPEAVPEGE